MKYLDLFSGYGGFSLGIQQAYASNQQSAEIEQDRKRGDGIADKMESDVLSPIWTAPLCIGFSEIDKYAIQVYNKHFPYEKCEKCRLADERQSEMPPPGDSEGQSIKQPDPSSKRLTCNCKHKNYGDIKSINPIHLPDFDLLTAGFPCQAFSIAGKRRGFEDTRGTLFFEIARILAVKRPKMFLLENVKGLLSHDNGRTFKTIITSLAELGYAVEWQVLNAKNFGVPQNRERVFIIGHLGGFGGRQVFPIKGTVGKDIIVSGVLDTETWRKRHEQIRRFHDIKGVSPTLPTGTGGGVMTKIEDNTRIRRLTPTECERLMGLPDGWTEGVSDTQRYKLCGNGVVVNVVKEIIKRLNNS